MASVRSLLSTLIFSLQQTVQRPSVESRWLLASRPYAEFPYSLYEKHGHVGRRPKGLFSLQNHLAKELPVLK
jgi:hypothetical protein